MVRVLRPHLAALPLPDALVACAHAEMLAGVRALLAGVRAGVRFAASMVLILGIFAGFALVCFNHWREERWRRG